MVGDDGQWEYAIAYLLLHLCNGTVYINIYMCSVRIILGVVNLGSIA
jgi:hypothetical protein